MNGTTGLEKVDTPVLDCRYLPAVYFYRPAMTSISDGKGLNYKHDMTLIPIYINVIVDSEMICGLLVMKTYRFTFIIKYRIKTGIKVSPRFYSRPKHPLLLLVSFHCSKRMLDW